MRNVTNSPSTSVVARRGGTPEWLVNLSALGWRVLVLAVLAAVAVAIATRLITVTASILAALLIAASFEPWMASLRARGWSKAKAAAVVRPDTPVRLRSAAGYRRFIGRPVLRRALCDESRRG